MDKFGKKCAQCAKVRGAAGKAGDHIIMFRSFWERESGLERKVIIRTASRAPTHRVPTH